MEHKALSRKRKQEEMGIDGANKQHRSDNGGIDKLPDDVLINIVSHMSFKEAVRASVLARRWGRLWKFFHGTLRFDDGDISTRYLLAIKKLESCVNTLNVHEGGHVDGVVVHFNVHLRGVLRGGFYHPTRRALDNLVYFATRKEVQTLEVKLSSHNGYDYDYCEYFFPHVGLLKSHSSFSSLRALRLSRVGVTDELVCYLLASCRSLEELCIRSADLLKNLRVIDPPSLRALEITRCCSIQSLEISAVGLVSLTYGGRKSRLLLKNIPNVRELALVDESCLYFVREPEKHSSYSPQLEKLVLDIRKLDGRYGRIVAPPDSPQLCSLIRLEVKVFILLGRRLLFTPLIKGSPHLREFRIELSYSVFPQNNKKPPFPGIISKTGRLVHRNLKVVEMAGYIGCSCAEELLLVLTRKCPSIERIVIDTASDYYSDDPRLYVEDLSKGDRLTYGRHLHMRATTRNVAKERAQRFVSKIPKQIKVSVS
ncbi:putative FBD-associated F-box protein At5g56690 [Salvia miltiorrhiza]|uniref:putative FBD-associated F-box protein At5g56690 n=1 Tax=Salvia miltiorrhiza TaxID=226208 RepID=UPI0025AD2302|nr:putative FBD-associated F-box protein At5g56690 [Salvia miltiorrhiza]